MAAPLLALTLILLLPTSLLSDRSPAHSPSLPPNSPDADLSPPPSTPSPAPAPGPTFFSPPAPPPSDLPPTTPPPAKTPTPAPSPVIGDISHENQPNASNLKAEGSSGNGGMSGGQKAGVAIGVIASAFVVGIGAFVYKKRRQNIQRANYGYQARRELL